MVLNDKIITFGQFFKNNTMKYKVMAGMLFSFEGETEAKLLGHSTIQTTQKLYCEVNKDIIATEVANAFAF